MGVIYLAQVPGDRFTLIDRTSIDPRSAEAFYREVAGLTIGSDPSLLPVASEQPLDRPEREGSGGVGAESGSTEPIWIAYIGVDDVDLASERAGELGGEVIMPPTELPGFGRAAVLRDSQGIAFGIFTRVRS